MRSLRYWRRHKIKLLISIIVLLIVVATESGWLNGATNNLQQNDPGLYAINRYVDGDTIDVNMNGSVETIRFIGVDTPETHKPNTPVQCYGPEASSYTHSLIGKNSLRLEADPLDTNRDRYGRLLRYIYLPDGTLVEAKLIGEGYGFAYTQFPFQKKAQFIALEQSAKQSGKGLWAACQVTVESGGREQTQPR
jgi:endonuclease YncB( thermonuclease family)